MLDYSMLCYWYNISTLLDFWKVLRITVEGSFLDFFDEAKHGRRKNGQFPFSSPVVLAANYFEVSTAN